MTQIALPDIHELDGVIADYVDALFPEMKFSAERASIIESCMGPFTQLIAMWESVNARGSVEERIWKAFMRDLCLMSDASALTKNEAGDERRAVAAQNRNTEAGSYKHRNDIVKKDEANPNIFASGNNSWSYLFPQRFQFNFMCNPLTEL